MYIQMRAYLYTLRVNNLSCKLTANSHKVEKLKTPSPMCFATSVACYAFKSHNELNTHIIKHHYTLYTPLYINSVL